MNWKNPIAVVIAAVALGVNPLSAAPLAKGEWAVRLVLKAEAEGLEDPYNVLGQLSDAAAGFDRHDLPELDQSFPGTYLSVIFYRPDWQAEKVTYNTDFHPVAPNVSDEWTFEVRSDDPTRDLSLTWVVKNANKKNMVLVDLQEGTVTPAFVNGRPQVYNFRMNGVVREFAWRLVAKEKNVPQTASFRADSRMAAEPKQSNWLPKGWGESKGYRSDGTPEGLPQDPFSDN